MKSTKSNVLVFGAQCSVVIGDALCAWLHGCDCFCVPVCMQQSQNGHIILM